MAGWHHRLNGHEFEQTAGDGDGQGGLACCGPWGRNMLDTTDRLNSSDISINYNKPGNGGFSLQIVKKTPEKISRFL